MAVRFNIRMAGVGGQGVVTGSHIFSTAVINAGGESTIVPFYGSEKRMAPVESYVRVSDEPIYEIGEITFPHILLIFHPQCITHGKSYTNPWYFGLKKDGVALINNVGPMKLQADHAQELADLNVKIYYLPATKLSLDVAGIDLATNMAMVGAIGAITGLTNMEALEQAVKDRFLGKGFVVSGGTAALDSVVERKFKKKAELIGKNLAVVKAAWDFAEQNGWAATQKTTSTGQAAATA
ncbi:MAG: 2-oxoacid:acceptor oxidoreductase family protein [Nitrospirales bacterium]|nr:2-oxoacid:acceptor oxidoreductase family protein [Nitrospirota bacterium]